MDGLQNGGHVVEAQDACEAIRYDRQVDLFEARADSREENLSLFLVQLVKRDCHVVAEAVDSIQTVAILNYQRLIPTMVRITTAELLLRWELEAVSEELELEDFAFVGVGPRKGLRLSFVQQVDFFLFFVAFLLVDDADVVALVLDAHVG